MKKYFFIILVLCLVFKSFLTSNQEVIEEKVEVINIEVPVRVMDKGKAVGGLSKTDFLIYENGKLQHIHGFNQYRRKIEISDITLDVKLPEVVYKPRLFVLVFNLTDFHLDMEKGIDFLFEKILLKNDRIMVLANNTLIPEKTITNLEMDKENLKTIVKRESKIAKHRLLKILKDIQGILARSGIRMSNLGVKGAMIALNMYKNCFQDLLNYFVHYKKNYLLPDINKFYNFAEYLEKVELEKWVINFYQLERFPKLKIKNRIAINRVLSMALSDSSQEAGQNIALAMVLQRLMSSLDKEMNMADDFPVEEISNLFLRVNATFHTIFMRSRNVEVSENFEYKRISADLENSLREITKKTGGELIGSNDLEKSLEKIIEKEDIFYILTYEPLDRQKNKRKIVVKLKDKSFKLIYNNNVVPDFFKDFLERKKKESPDIKIRNFKFEERTLFFYIVNFKTHKIHDRSLGKVEIHIKIIDKKNNVVFDKRKAILLKNKRSITSIRLNKIKKGEYYIFLYVKDLFTNKIHDIQQRIDIF